MWRLCDRPRGARRASRPMAFATPRRAISSRTSRSHDRWRRMASRFPDSSLISGSIEHCRLLRGKFEGEEEGGPRLYAAYLSVDHVHDEGSTETMGDDASRHCYTEAIEVDAHEHQPRIGEVVNLSLVIHGRAVINTRTRVRTRKMGRSVRKPNGVLLNQTDLPYEKAFGCLKMSS